VRQLRNVIEKMVVLSVGDRITPEDLPVEIATASAPPPAAPAQPASAPVTSAPAEAATLKDVEKVRILAALEECSGNKSKAAVMLGISRRTLHRKLNEWGMK
jgi:two-component system response regulator HydG